MKTRNLITVFFKANQVEYYQLHIDNFENLWDD